MKTIFGITFDEKNKKSFEKDFTLVRDLDEESYYETNKTFHHEEDGLTFDYKYVVLVACREDDNEDTYLETELYLTPTFNSLCDSTKLDMISIWGIKSLDELKENGWDISCCEVAEEGYGVRFADESYDAPDGWKSLDKDMLDDIASVIDVADSLRGFYIDNPWNAIGTTGWDTLHHSINGEKLFKF